MGGFDLICHMKMVTTHGLSPTAIPSDPKYCCYCKIKHPKNVFEEYLIGFVSIVVYSQVVRHHLRCATMMNCDKDWSQKLYFSLIITNKTQRCAVSVKWLWKFTYFVVSNSHVNTTQLPTSIDIVNYVNCQAVNCQNVNCNCLNRLFQFNCTVDSWSWHLNRHWTQ